MGGLRGDRRRDSASPPTAKELPEHEDRDSDGVGRRANTLPPDKNWQPQPPPTQDLTPVKDGRSTGGSPVRPVGRRRRLGGRALVARCFREFPRGERKTMANHPGEPDLQAL